MRSEAVEMLPFLYRCANEVERAMRWFLFTVITERAGWSCLRETRGEPARAPRGFVPSREAARLKANT